MSVNLLALEVGNTCLHLGCFVADELRDRRAIALNAQNGLAQAIREMAQPLRDTAEAEIYLASVNDPAAEPIARLAGQTAGLPVRRVEQEVRVPISRQLDAGATPGTDRLLNAAAAWDRLREACIIVDAGTAVTVDFVDGAGTFHGGAILPGLRTMLGALHHDTAQLPDLQPAAPEKPIGHNTADAMRSGVFHAIRGGVRELVEHYTQQYGGYPKVIATGGDAPLLFEGYELVEAIVPELTLMGLAVARRHHMEASGGPTT